MRPLRRTTSAVSWVSVLLSEIASLSVLALMAAISIDVVMREATGRAVPGLFELTELLLVLAVFLGMAGEQRSSGHIRVTMFTDRMGLRMSHHLRTLAYVLSAVVVLWLTVECARRAVVSFDGKEVRWGTVQFPVWPVRMAIAVGFLWYFLQLCVSLSRHVTDHSDETPATGEIPAPPTMSS